jgi:hypothetical protein
VILHVVKCGVCLDFDNNQLGIVTLLDFFFF